MGWDAEGGKDVAGEDISVVGLGSEDIRVDEEFHALAPEGGMGLNEKVIWALIQPLVALNFIEDVAHEVSVIGVSIGRPLDGMVAKAAMGIMMEVVELGTDEELECGVVAEVPKHPADAVSITLVSVEGNRAWSGHARAKGVFEDGIGDGCKGIGMLARLGAGEHSIGKVLVVIIGMMEGLFEVTESGWG